ncbi:MAG TPA: nitroreductase/quinone reductase family protein [Pseudonocardiaceae bacterium]|nr:nitroreductase/quinone reductase family protein [Pseudonocardiaceae bacterium]
MPDAKRQELNHAIIEEFRANAGVVGGQFAGTPLLLLTTKGARTGLARTWPLGFMADADRWVVFAANGGRPNVPAWYHNLLAEPDATIEIGTETIPVRATVTEGPERADLWTRKVAEMPALERMQQTAPGPIPVVALVRRPA